MLSFELHLVLDLLIIGLTSIITLFIVIKQKKGLLLACLTPLIVMVTVDAFTSMHSLMGLSRPDLIPEKEVMVIGAVAEKRDFIHVWYYDQSVGQPRAIKIPYTEGNAKALMEILKRLRAGQRAMAEFKGKGDDDNEVTSMSLYDFKDLPENKKDRPGYNPG